MHTLRVFHLLATQLICKQNALSGGEHANRSFGEHIGSARGRAAMRTSVIQGRSSLYAEWVWTAQHREICRPLNTDGAATWSLPPLLGLITVCQTLYDCRFTGETSVTRKYLGNKRASICTAEIMMCLLLC